MYVRLYPVESKILIQEPSVWSAESMHFVRGKESESSQLKPMSFLRVSKFMSTYSVLYCNANKAVFVRMDES